MTASDFTYHGDVVVFDLDDTLVRERDFCRSGFRAITPLLIERYGPALRVAPVRMDSHLRTRRNYFGWLEEAIGEDPVEYLKLYREHRPENLRMIPDARPVVDALHRAGVRMAIVTDGRSLTQRRKIEALGLQHVVDPADILISEETGHDKTAPDNFAAIVRRYPEARRFYYVADNVAKDFRMPNLLGWTTLQVPPDADNVHPPVEPTDILSKPTVKLTSYPQILSILGVNSGNMP